jgi:hypothetical protein
MPQQLGSGKPGGVLQRRRALRRLALQQQLRATRLENKSLALKSRSERLAMRANKLRGKALQSRKKALLPKAGGKGKAPK